MNTPFYKLSGKQVKRKSKKLSTKANVRGSNDKQNAETTHKDTNNKLDINTTNYCKKTKERNSNKKAVAKQDSKVNVTKSRNGQKFNMNFKNMSNSKESNILNQSTTKASLKKNMKSRYKKKKPNVNKDVILKKFEMYTDSVKKNCDKLEQKTRNLVDKMRKKAYNIFVNENIVLENNKPIKHINISVRKQIDEIIIHKNASNRHNAVADKHNASENIKNKLVQSNYDLLQTILNTQQENSFQMRNVVDNMNNTGAVSSPPAVAKVTRIDDANEPINTEIRNKFTEPMVTFKSHNYYIHQSFNKGNDSFNSHAHIWNENQHGFHNKPRTFITKQSRDNFVIPNDILKSNNFKKKNLRTGLSKQFQSQIRSLFKQTSKLFNLKKQIMDNTGESSYTIKFTESNSYSFSKNNYVIMTDASRNARMRTEETIPYSENHTSLNNDLLSINTGTYVVPNVDNNGYTMNDDYHWVFGGTYTIEKANKGITDGSDSQDQNDKTVKSQTNRNFIFVSKSEEHDQSDQVMDPVDVCETILHSNEFLDKEFERSFNETENSLLNKHIYTSDVQENCEDSLYRSFYSKETENVPKDQNLNTQKIHANKVSNHLSHNKNVTNKVNDNKTPIPILTPRQNTNIEKQLFKVNDSCNTVAKSRLHNFNFVDRICFLPKGNLLFICI